jgi:tRNA 5-methylaminomethyl-2-thiouridine biosynthesis bifunctional protein
VLIVGAGIAAASLARAFSAAGQPFRVIADQTGMAASGNPAALVTPALDAGGGPRAAFYADAFARGIDLYEDAPDAIIARGCWQLEAEARDASRFDRIASQDLFEPGVVRRLSASEAAEALGEPQGEGGLLLQGLVIDPAAVRSAWLPPPTNARVTRLWREEQGWAIELSDGRVDRAPAIVLACALDAGALAGLTLSPVRGQASVADGLSTRACAFGAYAIPTRTGVLFGATHDRGETAIDVRDEDHHRNLAALARRRPDLARRLGGTVLSGRAAVRATTPDRMPIAGEAAPGLFVLSGLGSRGFCTAPLLAEHIAALVEGAPSPLRRDLAAIVDPRRLAQP